MDCSVIYYISYKTGYIQRLLNKKFSTLSEIKLTSVQAAVSEKDFEEKLEKSLQSADLIIIFGGLSAAESVNTMTVLSKYFNDNDMELTFNKKVLNPIGGKDGYLIKSGEKYIAVLPDEPAEVDAMLGSELMKNIDIAEGEPAEMTEQVRTHSIVFAPEPEYSLDRLNGGRKSNIIAILCVVLGAAVVLASVLWIIYVGR